MAVWDDLTGQADAIAIFRAAAERPGAVATLERPGGDTDAASAADPEVARPGTSTASTTSASMTHAWLITGPPGSGRSNLAFAFATALLSDGTPQGDTSTGRL